MILLSSHKSIYTKLIKLTTECGDRCTARIFWSGENFIESTGPLSSIRKVQFKLSLRPFTTTPEAPPERTVNTFDIQKITNQHQIRRWWICPHRTGNCPELKKFILNSPVDWIHRKTRWSPLTLLQIEWDQSRVGGRRYLPRWILPVLLRIYLGADLQTFSKYYV